ncbi:endonuclease domain-containing protein, partial [Candidatus Parcubacteria bacterium]
MLHYSRKLKPFARQLRKNMTDAERLLWSRIRRKQLGGYQFYRQRAIGEYIVDFYCPRAKLVIEVDGGQHYTNEGKARDRERDRFLRGLVLNVLRFGKKDVIQNLAGV